MVENFTRNVEKVVRGMPASDGAGVRLTRVIAQPLMPDLDPFLLLDEFRSDRPNEYAAGFPDHPHRGFETVTYMLAGRMRHHDSKGNSGLLTAGSVQWMTAGSGIVHSEMPEQENGLLWGFQLWVNLPASDKMTAPRYQDIAPDRIPAVHGDNADVRVIAGHYNGAQGPVHAPRVDAIYLNVALQDNGAFTTQVPATHNAFVYVFDGESVVIGDQRAAQEVRRGQLAVLTRGTSVAVQAKAAARFLLVAGKPLGEPIARHGPIVMNTQAELRQAFADLSAGRFET